MNLLFGIQEALTNFEVGTKSADFKGLKQSILQTRKLDRQKELFDQLKTIADQGIYVGIPEETATRPEGEMNNATLLYIHTHGSPVMKIPPRPLIEPAIEFPENAQKIADDLAEVSRATLDNSPELAMKLMNVTGQDAVNMIDDWFESSDNNWAKNKPATVRAKIKKKYKSKKKIAETLEAYKAGESVDVDQPLVDTGELRKSITYVVGGKAHVKGKKK